MLRSLGVVVAGLVIGFVLVMAFELAGMRLFPLPAGVDPMGIRSRWPGRCRLGRCRWAPWCS